MILNNCFLKALSRSFLDFLFVSARKVLSWAWVVRAQRSLLMPQDLRGFGKENRRQSRESRRLEFGITSSKKRNQWKVPDLLALAELGIKVKAVEDIEAQPHCYSTAAG